MAEKLTLAVVDDHKLFRSGLVNLIHSLDPAFTVSVDVGNGHELLHHLQTAPPPQIVLLDLNMPVMDGHTTALALQKEHPSIKILVITMNGAEQSLIKMLKAGACGYIGKDIEPSELKHALLEIKEKGYYYTDQLTGKLIQSLHLSESNTANGNSFSEQELNFIRLACSEDTYSQIADKMFLSPKTIDGYRASVFEKLNIKSRVGLAIYAIKSGLVAIDK